MTDWMWSLPMFPDEGSHPGVPARAPALPHLTSIARSAEQTGFKALLLGAGFGQHIEAFTTAAALLQHAPHIRALIAVRPGFYHPAVVAKLATTVDQHSGGRVLLNVVTGGIPSDLAAYGDTLDHDQRYARTGEFLEILTRLTSNPEPFTYTGQYLRCDHAALRSIWSGSGNGRIYFGGTSEPAREIAARHADVYLTWGLPIDDIKQTITDLTRRADRHQRRLRFGLRINVIARPTREQAWQHADDMTAAATAQTLTTVARANAETDSVGQRGMAALATQPVDRSTGFWTGLGALRVGSGTALVGSYPDVAGHLARYRDAGIDTFILAASPNLEECLRIGENVLPRLT